MLWQKDNIVAVYDGLSQNETDIQNEITDSKQSIQAELEQYDVTGLRDFTFEEEEAIRKGQITVEEAVQKIIAESVAEGGTVPKSVSPQGSATTVSNPTAEIVSEYTIKLYSLKAVYLGKIGNVIDNAKADYKAGMRPKELMSKYLSAAANLESEADSKVDSLLAELTNELNSVGADTSIVKTMKSSYENEKSLKKSYYMSLFNKKK